MAGLSLLTTVDAAGAAGLRYPLVLPERSTAAAQYDKPFVCEKPIAPMVDMSNIGTFYKAGATQSVIDKEAMASYVKRNKLVDQTRASLRRMVRRAITSSSDRTRIGPCIMRQLVVWAKADALLGNLDDNDPKGRRQAILITAFDMKSFTDAYSVALQLGAPTEKQRTIVEEWLGKLGDAIIAEFTPPSSPRPKSDRWLDRNANTRYWGASAVGLVAALTQNNRQLDWAMDALHTGLAQSDADGSFPIELSRGGRALHYQSFAMKALALLVVIADENGRTLSREDEQRLATAARFSAEAYEKPESIASRTGEEQLKNPEMAEWMPLLSQHFAKSDPDLVTRLHTVTSTLNWSKSGYLIGFAPPG
ncbi:hypothetical protein ACO34A_00725 [Rhizobium sp. ACO-34A]|nr:hypothetical protein ACO34A_00725 [Rhizobium sp. ACO-34A]